MKSCVSWCWSPWICGSPPAHAARRRRRRRARALRVGQLNRADCTASATAVRSTCSRIGRTKSSTSCTMALAILASLMMSVSTACASGASGILRRSSAGHHLDAGERILHLVRDHRRHLADRGEPIAQPLAFLELLDAREVLEEHRRADHLAGVVAHQRQRVADHLVPTASAASRRGSAAGAGRTRRSARGPRRGASLSTVGHRLAEIVGLRA